MKVKFKCPSCGASRIFWIDQPRGFNRLVDEIGKWQDATFPHATPASVAAHLRREAIELENHPENAEEIADIMFLCIGAARALKVNLSEILALKFAINKARRWKAPDHEGVCEHEKTERPSA
jgi:hypothetical protein